LVNAHIVASRIHRIRECVGFLKKIGQIVDEDRFLKDPLLTASAERYLQVAIQAMLDICNHIVADMGLEAPSEYRQVPDILAERKLLPIRLSKRMSAMIGLRNILVHEYLKVDRRLVYNVLKKDLGDFQSFIKAVNKFL
jgi:uncharacterized protein YutE (UPF0331/DUF86 family)